MRVIYEWGFWFQILESFHFTPYKTPTSTHFMGSCQKGKLAMSKMMIKIVVLAIVMSLILTFKVAAGSVHGSSNGASTVVSCSKVERNLVNCSSFLSIGSTTKKPETSCCSGVVKTVVKTDPGCLCEAFKDTNQLGYTPNLTRTLNLPAACNVSAPSFRNCTIFIGVGGGPPPGDAYHVSNNDAKKSSNTLGIILGYPLGALTIALLLSFFALYMIKKSSKMKKDEQNLDIVIEGHGFLALKRYSYLQIKKMTNSFRDKLGEGGFGEVYKGILNDGRDSRRVAVKILKASKADGEEFINEVINIGGTSHVNVVTLLGFCIDGKERALVYEFMANGSLDKYIYKETMPKSARIHLGWERLYQIALGVARGLEYLHRGCNTRILHFDIKPHNILLDQDFCPKISDFGLAKQCKKKESIISMMETRGTIGYIAPEVISRNFGGVSHKSDVYSYGMMLLEMVGGRKNTCPLVSQTSEIYFPHWAYERMVVGGDLKLQGVTTGEEIEMAKKMIIVGLWCIQNDPMQRPAMRKVTEMLEGSLESIEIPPKPFFGYPSRIEADPSDTTEEIKRILEANIEVYNTSIL